MDRGRTPAITRAGDSSSPRPRGSFASWPRRSTSSASAAASAPPCSPASTRSSATPSASRPCCTGASATRPSCTGSSSACRPSDSSSSRSGACRTDPARPMRRRILGLALTALMLYGVAPAVVDVLGGWHDLDRVSPAWWAAVLATQVAGWGCLWVVQRLALNRAPWFPVATSQLASGALGRVVPGGAAATAALQYRMLARAGLAQTAVATGLAAGSLVLLGALCALPVLAVPALIAGRRIPTGLLEAGGLSLVVFACLFAIGALLMVSDRAIRWVGRATAAVLRRARPRRPAPADLPERLAVERDLVRRILGRRWPKALAAAV